MSSPPGTTLRVPTLPGHDFNLPRGLEGLDDLAYNLWWSWTPRAGALFSRLDPAAWARHRNPIAVLASMVAAAGFAAYVGVSASFSSTYGPLAGVFALLLWSLLSSMGLFYGLAVCAQLEALRAGEADPAYDDPGRPHRTTVGNSDEIAPAAGSEPG